MRRVLDLRRDRRRGIERQAMILAVDERELGLDEQLVTPDRTVARIRL